MISSLFTNILHYVVPTRFKEACKEQFAKAFPNVSQFQKGTVVQAAQTEVKEFAKGFFAQTVGFQLGTYFPQGAIAARIVLGAGQVAHKFFGNPPPSSNASRAGEFDEAVTEMSAEIKGQIAGLTAATVTALLLAYSYLSGDGAALSSGVLQPLIAILGTCSGGFVALWMEGKDPTDHKSPWYDNYISRNVRFTVGQNAVQMLEGLPMATSITTLATGAGYMLPAPLDSCLTLPAKVADGIFSFFRGQVGGHLGYFAIPASKALYRFIYFKPIPSNYKNLDPNLLIKTVINTLYGNSAALAHELMTELPIAAALKDLIAQLIAKGVTEDRVVNLIVRSVNEYATLIQDEYIQAGIKKLSDAVKVHEQSKAELAKKPQLQAVLKQLSDSLPAENVSQTVKDLQQYHDLLTTDAKFKKKFTDLVAQKKELHQLLPGNSCNRLILDIYKATSSSLETCQMIQHLLALLHVTLKKHELNVHLYSKMMDKVPDNLSLPPCAQSMIQEALTEVEKQEEILLGKPISNKAQNQAMIEVFGQGFQALIVKKANLALKDPASPQLTEDELEKFYLNLHQLAWAPLPYTLPQRLHCFFEGAILCALTFGEGVPRFIESVLKDPGKDDLIAKNPPLVPELTVIRSSETSQGLISPATITHIAINNMYGSPLALVQAIAHIAITNIYGDPLALQSIVEAPLFQALSHQLIAKPLLQSNLLVNTFVRSVNRFTEIFDDPAIQKGIKELAAASTDTKEIKKKALNKLIYKKIFESFTMSTFERLFAYTTKSAIAKRLKPNIQKIITGLKENKIDLFVSPLLSKDHDETTLEVCLRGFIILNVLMTRKGMTYERKNLPLQPAENEKFYSNLINLTFAPLSHPVTDLLKPTSKTALPLVLNEVSRNLPLILRILNEASGPAVIEEISEDEFKASLPTVTPLEPLKDTSVSLFSRIQKTWVKFVAALNELVDRFKRSISTLAPENKKTHTHLKKVETRVFRKRTYSYSVYTGPKKSPAFKASQTQKVAASWRTRRGRRNASRVR